MNNLLEPAVLFFAFGMFAGFIKSNLEIPPQIARFLSLYLLMALGLKGGFALAKSGLGGEVATTLASAILLAVVIPLLGYLVLRTIVSDYNAAAIAATYGSVSAVTFITATQYLEGAGLAYGGHMAAAMALMESPAILIAVLLANRTRRLLAADTARNATGAAPATAEPERSGAGQLRKLLHESLTDGAQMLLLGSLVIGMVTGEAGKTAMQPFSGDLFKGMLAFFLLDMGLLASRNMPGLKGTSPLVLLYALAAPFAHAALAFALARWFGIGPGNTALLMVLAASASYIAVPAAIRYAIPEANPSLYFSMSLAITFPLNLIVGIPLYAGIAQTVR